MWLTPQEIEDKCLETSNKAFVLYLPLIFFYLLLSSYSIVLYLPWRKPHIFFYLPLSPYSIFPLPLSFSDAFRSISRNLLMSFCRRMNCSETIYPVFLFIICSMFCMLLL